MICQRICEPLGAIQALSTKKLLISPPPLGLSCKPLDPEDEAFLFNCPSVIPGNPLLNRKEVIRLMRERLVENREEIMQALRMFKQQGSSNISKNNLKKVLDNFWVRLNDLQFERLLNDIQENGDGSIDYRQLLVRIEGKRHLQYGLLLGCRRKLESVAPDALNVDGLELLLYNKIKGNLEQVVRGILMYDENREGFISRKNLKKVLDNFAVITKENQFNQLIRKYDRFQSDRISYREFFILLGRNCGRSKKYLPAPTAEAALRWALPAAEEREEEGRKIAYKFNRDDPRLLGIPLEQVAEMFQDKVLSKYSQLEKAFLTFDIAHTGLVSPADFHHVLNYFVYPTSEAVYKELFHRFHIKKVNQMIAWENFLEAMKLDAVQCPKEKRILIHKWDKDPHTSIWAKVGNAEICKCADVTNIEAPLTLPHILSQLRRYNIVPGPTVKKAFRIKTRAGEPIMTRSEFRLLLGRRCCFLPEKEFKDLLSLLDPDNTNYITYSRFYNFFCENPAPPAVESDEDSPCEEEELPAFPSGRHLPPVRKMLPKASEMGMIDVTVLAPSFPELCPESAMVKLRRRLHKEWNNIERTMKARAHERPTGYILQDELKQILDVFVMSLTEPQWRHLLRMLGVFKGQIGVQHFLETFKELEEESVERWNRQIEKWLGSCQQPEILQDELENYLYKVVKEKGKEMHRDLAKQDKLKLGLITKEAFHQVIAKHVPIMTDEQFECLWRRLPVNEFCNMDYVDFLKRYRHYYCEGMPSHRCECECELALQNMAEESLQCDCWKTPEYSHGDCLCRLHGGQNQNDDDDPALRKKKNSQVEPQAGTSGSVPRRSLVQRQSFNNPNVTRPPTPPIKSKSETSHPPSKPFNPLASENSRPGAGEERCHSHVLQERKCSGNLCRGVLLEDQCERTVKEDINKTADDQFHKRCYSERLPSSKQEADNFEDNRQFCKAKPVSFKQQNNDRECLKENIDYSCEKNSPIERKPPSLYHNINICRGDDDEEEEEIEAYGSMMQSEPHQTEVCGDNDERMPVRFTAIDKKPEITVQGISKEDCYRSIDHDYLKACKCYKVHCTCIGGKNGIDDDIYLTSPAHIHTLPKNKKQIRPCDSESEISSSSVEQTFKSKPFECKQQRRAQVDAKPKRCEPDTSKLDSLDTQLCVTIQKHWRELHQVYHQIDCNGLGLIDGAQFRAVLGQYGIPVSLPEMQIILKKFDVPLEGAVNYLEFLQQFVIQMKPKPVGLLGRRRWPRFPEMPQTPGFFPNGTLQRQFGAEIRLIELRHVKSLCAIGEFEILLSVGSSIPEQGQSSLSDIQWSDKTGRGWIHALEFQRILRKYKIPYTEEQFFYLMEYFDPNLTGHISYNIFMRVFNMAK